MKQEQCQLRGLRVTEIQASVDALERVSGGREFLA